MYLERMFRGGVGWLPPYALYPGLGAPLQGPLAGGGALQMHAHAHAAHAHAAHQHAAHHHAAHQHALHDEKELAMQRERERERERER